VRHLKDDLHLVRELDLAFFQAASLAVRSESLTLQTAPSAFETDVLDLVNQERAAQNLLPLSWDNQLHEAARNHSEDMAANNYFSHTSLDGRAFVDRIEDAGYWWNAAGENIAAGYSTPQAVMNGWMNSAGHRQNILNSAYCDLGVGYAYDQSSAYDHYWTQDFGRRTGVTVCLNVANQPPSASFIATPFSGLPSLLVQFDASGSVDPEGGLLSFDWNFGDGQTGSGKIVAHTYTEVGSYTVTLTVTDNRGASDTLVRMNYVEVEAPPAESARDELLGDFGSAYGLWHYDRVGGWQQVNTVDPGLMVAVDVDGDGQDELAATFSGYGLWIYDPGNAPANRWRQLNPIIPEAMIRMGNGIACDYGTAHGLWSWTQAAGWQQVNTVDPGLMVSVDVDNDAQDELVVTFSGYGLWIYDPGNPLALRWKQLNPIVPEAMIRMGNGIACDYRTAYGLWSWTQAGGWRQLNSVNPGLMVAVDLDNDQQEELVVTFSGYGLYSYDSTSGWQQLNPGVPEAMIRMGNGIACDYGVAYGLWFWTQAGGWQQLNAGDPDLMAAVNLDNDQQEELVVNFTGYGLFSYDPITGWTLLNSLSPNAMAPANLFN
jgi:uncharacterized protein YkwD